MMNCRSNIRCLWIYVLPAALGSLLAWQIYRAASQEMLDQALIAAIEKNRTEAVASLLKQGADPNARGQTAETRFLLQQLFDGLLDSRFQLRDSTPALLIALKTREQDAFDSEIMPPENVPLIEALLNKGADINARDADGKTALMWAAMEEKTRTIRVLLERGADVNVKDKYGSAALDYAVGDSPFESDRPEGFMLLKQAGAKE